MRTESYGEWLKINSTLNAFITEDLISLEDKGKTMIQVNNNLSIIITSNDSPIKMNEKDRRYFLSDVSNHRDGDKEYFNKLYEYMHNEAIQKAFYTVTNPYFNFTCIMQFFKMVLFFRKEWS